jgi:hypothetical protein
MGGILLNDYLVTRNGNNYLGKKEHRQSGNQVHRRLGIMNNIHDKGWNYLALRFEPT